MNNVSNDKRQTPQALSYHMEKPEGFKKECLSDIFEDDDDEPKMGRPDDTSWAHDLTPQLSALDQPIGANGNVLHENEMMQLQSDGTYRSQILIGSGRGGVGGGPSLQEEGDGSRSVRHASMTYRSQWVRTLHDLL
jgi:hypothetical protein